jgi:purine-nucleoside phosphorylase
MSNKSIYKKARKAADYLAGKLKKRKPRVAIVLGSGLGGVADAVSDPIEIHYGDIPNFPVSTVDGHAGKLIIGSLGGVEVLLMKGRFHFYEGYTMKEITLPVRVFSLLGIHSIILTNAAGGTSAHLGPGSLMLINDHLNLMGDNPLRGRNEDRFGIRFPDMTDVYTFAYRELAKESARELGMNLAEGVYLALRGPIYETPAEVRMMRNLGGDALGMSTVPEAIVARHAGMKVLAFSCITNYAAGMSGEEINHLEVMDVGEKAGKQLAELIIHIIPRLAHEGAKR